MERFQDLSHLQKVVDAFKESHENLVNNMTSTKKELARVISEGRLFYQIYPHTLLVFRDELDFYQLMLFTDGTIENIALPSDKPCSSLVSNALRKGNAKERLMKKLESMNFKLEGNYSAYKTDMAEAYPVAKAIVDDMKEEIKNNGYEILPFQEKYIDEIHRLWSMYLKRYHILKEQWNFEFEKDFVLLLFDMKSATPKLAATAYLFKKDASYLASGLAVASEYRHDMLGIYLNALQMCSAYEAGISSAYAWKLDGNDRAIKTGEIFGTKRLPLESLQYYSG